MDPAVLDVILALPEEERAHFLSLLMSMSGSGEGGGGGGGQALLDMLGGGGGGGGGAGFDDDMGAMFGGGVGRQTPPGKKEHYSGDWDSCLCSEHDGFRCPPLATNHDGFFAFLLGMRHVDAMAPVLAAGPDVWRIIHTLSHRATGYKEAKSVGGRYSASDLQFAWKTTKNCECHARDEHCTAHCQCLRRGACDNVPDHCTCAAGKCVALSCPCVSAGRPCNERCAVCGQHQQGKGEQQQPGGGAPLSLPPLQATARRRKTARRVAERGVAQTARASAKRTTGIGC